MGETGGGMRQREVGGTGRGGEVVDRERWVRQGEGETGGGG